MNKTIVTGLIGLSAFFMFSCKKSDPLPTFETLTDFFNQNTTTGTSYTVNVDTDADTLVTANGNTFIFPVGSFNKSGDVTVVIKELTNVSELVLTNKPNQIDSTFNKNAVMFEVSSSDVTFNAAKSYKVVFNNNKFAYNKVSIWRDNSWIYDNSYAVASSSPNAGDAPSIFSNGNTTEIVTNKFGTFAASTNPNIGTKNTKIKIKVYGFVTDKDVNAYVISGSDNAVNAAKRITDSEFVSDSVAVGSSLKIVCMSFSQKYKYAGFAQVFVKDTLTVPVSMHEVTDNNTLKSEVINYLK